MAGTAPDNRVKLGLGLVLVAQAIVCGLVASRSGPLTDDIVHFFLAQKVGFTWRYLWWPNFDHLGFGQNLLHYLLFYRSGASWNVVIATSVVSNTLSTYTAWRVAKLLAGPTFWAVTCAALVGLSPYWVNTWFWWSSVADFLIPIPACFLALELFIRRAQGGTRWLSLPIALLLAASLLCRERMAMMPGAFALLALALEADRLSPRGALRCWLKLWDVWASSIVVLIAWAVVLVKGSYFAGQLPGGGGSMNFAKDSGQFFTFIWTIWTQMLLPGVVGVLPRVLPMPTAWALVSNAVVVALGVLALRCVPRSGRALGYLLGATMLSVFPVALGRAGSISFATEPRYAIDALLFFAPALALIGREVVAGRTHRVPAWLPRLGPTLTAGLIALGALGTTVTAFRYQDAGWPNLALARQLRHTIAALPAGADETFLPGLVPQRLLLAPLRFNADWAQVGTLVKGMRPELTIADAAAHHVTTIDADAKALRFSRGAPVDTAAKALQALPADWSRPSAAPQVPVVLTTAPPLGAHWVLAELHFAEATYGIPFLTPVRLLKDGTVVRSEPVPGPSITQLPLMATLQLDGTEAGVGFELPASTDGVVSSLTLSALTPE